MVFACLAALFGPAHRAGAQITLDLDAVLDLAEAPWRDRAGFARDLRGALQGTAFDRPGGGGPVALHDPFLWTIAGRFGDAPGMASGRAGGVVRCARYGLETRDLLREAELSDPSIFVLFSATLAAHDDAKVWPEEAIARLSCMITWDDPRRVAILDQVTAQRAIDARFRRLTTRESSADRSGYSVLGRDGEADGTVWVESARIERGPAHQAIRFRAFLLNGGV